jgi:hypothetical protein
MWWITTMPPAPVGAVGVAAYASMARPPYPETVVVPERKASLIVGSFSWGGGVGAEPAVGDATKDRDGRGQGPAFVVGEVFDVG